MAAQPSASTNIATMGPSHLLIALLILLGSLPDRGLLSHRPHFAGFGVPYRNTCANERYKQALGSLI